MLKNSVSFVNIISHIILLIVIIILVKTASNFINTSSEDDVSSIEDGINSALMQCYALEGAYPADIYYLKDYGVWFNDDKYYYYYEYLDGGIMPTVAVTHKIINEDESVFIY